MKEAPLFEPGVHYVASDGDGRVLMPDLEILHNLRHKWYWKRRFRPHVPVWSYAKVPKPNLSPEENARLLSLYMRPWTLNSVDATIQVPLLSKLRVTAHADPQKAALGQETTGAAQETTNVCSAAACVQTPKRRRYQKKAAADPTPPPKAEKLSYAESK